MPPVGCSATLDSRSEGLDLARAVDVRAVVLARALPEGCSEVRRTLATDAERPRPLDLLRGVGREPRRNARPRHAAAIEQILVEPDRRSLPQLAPLAEAPLGVAMDAAEDARGLGVIAGGGVGSR